MAAGHSGSNWVIYQEEFFAGMTEVLEQNSELFNAASRGAIRLVTERKKGDYERQSFVENISGLVAWRDVGSIGSAASTPMAMDEWVSVKLNRRIGPVEQTRDSFRKLGRDPALMSFLLGQQAAKSVLVDQVDSTLIALDAALSGIATLCYDATGQTTKTATHPHLVSVMAKMGDAANRLICWVMHSKPFFDLMQQSITDNIFQVGGLTIINGTVATFNKPTIVIDSSALLVSGTPDNYVTLGLVDGAAVVAESEEREIVSETVTGQENLHTRVQGELAYNLGVKGFKWDISSGGRNPNAAALGTTAYWDQASNDRKSLAGVRLLTQ
jgi:hypothetical protein